MRSRRLSAIYLTLSKPVQLAGNVFFTDFVWHSSRWRVFSKCQSHELAAFVSFLILYEINTASCISSSRFRFEIWYSPTATATIAASQHFNLSGAALHISGFCHIRNYARLIANNRHNCVKCMNGAAALQRLHFA